MYQGARSYGLIATINMLQNSNAFKLYRITYPEMVQQLQSNSSHISQKSAKQSAYDWESLPCSKTEATSYERNNQNLEEKDRDRMEREKRK